MEINKNYETAKTINKCEKYFRAFGKTSPGVKLSRNIVSIRMSSGTRKLHQDLRCHICSNWLQVSGILLKPGEKLNFEGLFAIEVRFGW